MRITLDHLRWQRVLLACMLLAITPQVRAQTSVRAELIEGGTLTGEILSLNAEGIALKSQNGPNGPSSVGIEELRRLQISPSESTTVKAPYIVQLIGGSTFRCSDLAISTQSFVASIGSSRIELAPNSLMRIQISALSTEQLQAWETISNSVVDSDVAVLIRKSGAVTKIEGIVEAMEGENLQFDYDGTIEIPFEKVAGVRFYTGQEKSLPKALCELKDVSGNTFILSDANSSPDGKSLIGTLRSGDTLSIPWARVQELDFSLANMRYLAELKLLRNSAPKLFEFDGIDLGESQLFGVQVLPPRWTPGRTVGPSLSFLGPGEALYEVPDGFSQLEGKVVLKPTGNKFSPVKIEIAAEGRTVWEETLKQTNEPKLFSIKLEGGQRVRLRVQSVGPFPTGNVVLWQEPKLKK